MKGINFHVDFLKCSFSVLVTFLTFEYNNCNFYIMCDSANNLYFGWKIIVSSYTGQFIWKF